MWAELARTGNAFCLDFTKKIVSNSGYILIIDDSDDNLLYLVAFLNSACMLYSLNQISTRLDTTGWRWLRQFVELLRIPPFVEKDRIIDLMKSMTAINKNDVSVEINSLIARIYGFTTKEEEYIYKQLGKFTNIR